MGMQLFVLTENWWVSYKKETKKLETEATTLKRCEFMILILNHKICGSKVQVMNESLDSSRQDDVALGSTVSCNYHNIFHF